MIRNSWEYLWIIMIIAQWALAIGFSFFDNKIYWTNFGLAIAVTVCIAAGFILRERHRRKHSISMKVSPIMNSTPQQPTGNIFTVAFGYQPVKFPNPYAAFTDNKHVPKVVEEDTPYYGWRSYTLDEDSMLHGSIVSWPERELQAECMFEHSTYDDEAIRSVLQDDVAFEFWKERQRYAGVTLARSRCLEHLENNSCPDGNGCGIWGRAEPQEAWIIGHCMAYGTVLLDNEGNWRASDVRIEALFINKQLFELSLAGRVAIATINKYIDYERMALDLSQRYGVPVEVVDGIDHLRSKVTTLPALT